MSSGPDSVKEIAEMTGVPVVTVDRHAKELKPASIEMWARSSPGGGRASGHVFPYHLTNLALGLSASPITSTVAIVREIRALEPQEVGQSGPFLSGRTLGEALDGFIADGAQDWLLDVKITKTAGRPRHAWLEGHNGDGNIFYCHYAPPMDLLASMLGAPPVAAVSTSFSLRPNLFIGLAALWADTQRHLAQTKSAAPGRAAPHDQDRENATIRELNTPESRGREGISQPLSRLGSGPSANRHQGNLTYAEPYAATTLSR